MKTSFSFVIFSGIILMLFFGCGGGGDSGAGSGVGSGTLSIDITDAMSMLPDGTTEVNVTIEAVFVHKKGGGWVECDLIEQPFTVNLLDWQSGNTTVLVPDCQLESGDYTQVRFLTNDANIVISDDTVHCVKVPSDSLKTDKNFYFQVENGGFVALTADFDPGQSIVDAGQPGGCSYLIKPVIHLLLTHKAATICGSIAEETFVGDSPQEGVVTVTWDENSDKIIDADEIYTQVKVVNINEPTTDFCIFWVDPGKDFNVVVEVDDGIDLGEILDEPVDSINLSAGETFRLNGDNPI